TNDEARQVVEAMGGLGDLVREGIDSRWLDQHAAPIADGVMKKLEAEPTLVKRRPAERPSERAAALTFRMRKPSVAGRVAAVGVGVLAMAAAAMLYFKNEAPVPQPVAGAGSVSAPAPHVEPSAVAQASPAGSGTQPTSGTGGTG